MKYYKILLIATALFYGVLVQAQSQGIAYTEVGKGVATTFVTDYHSLGINPSALGWGTGYEGKHFTVGTTEFSFGIMSPQLSKQGLKNAFDGIKQTISNRGQGINIDMKKQLAAAGEFAEKGISINGSFNWFGAAFQSEGFGGIALSITDEYNWYSQLNKKTTDIVFRGMYSQIFDSLMVDFNGDTTIIANRNDIAQDTLDAVVQGILGGPILLSNLTEGSTIKFAWNRYFNIGYGRKLFGNEKVALYAGVGARYIQSVGLFDMESTSDGINANVALSPYFGIDFGLGGQNNSTGKRSILPKTVGHGYGFDLAVSAELFNFIKIAASVNNIGAVTYKHKAYSVKDTLLNIYSGSGMATTNIPTSMSEISNILDYHGEQKLVVKNSADFRLGASVSLWKNRINAGIDFVLPFNGMAPGGLKNAVFAVGGSIRPLKFIELSVGYFGGGVYAHGMPLGVNFIMGNGRYEFGISSRDVLSFFMKNGHSLSASFGAFRMRF